MKKSISLFAVCVLCNVDCMESKKIPYCFSMMNPYSFSAVFQNNQIYKSNVEILIGLVKSFDGGTESLKNIKSDLEKITVLYEAETTTGLNSTSLKEAFDNLICVFHECNFFSNEAIPVDIKSVAIRLCKKLKSILVDNKKLDDLLLMEIKEEE